MLTNTFGNFGLSKKQHRRTKLVKRQDNPVDLGVDLSSSGRLFHLLMLYMISGCFLLWFQTFKSMPVCFDFLLDNDGSPAFSF